MILGENSNSTGQRVLISDLFKEVPQLTVACKQTVLYYN